MDFVDGRCWLFESQLPYTLVISPWATDVVTDPYSSLIFVPGDVKGDRLGLPLLSFWTCEKSVLFATS